MKLNMIKLHVDELEIKAVGPCHIHNYVEGHRSCTGLPHVFHDGLYDANEFTPETQSAFAVAIDKLIKRALENPTYEIHPMLEPSLAFYTMRL